ncbi:MAG: dockerin type I repeat-containing protein [Ruminococcus sp.]|nr:dockerin type I repeat-containing protein [Ruminococcus sp.]
MTSVCWSTSLDDPSYWLNGDGVFCTVKGTVAKDASGTIPIEIVPASRNTYPGSATDNEVISVGYFQNKDVIRYSVNTENGEISVGGSSSQSTSGSGDKYFKGDANEDGKLNISDAVLIMQALSNPNDYQLTKQGAKNADVNGDGGVTTADALEIQMHDIGLPSELD